MAQEVRIPSTSVNLVPSISDAFEAINHSTIRCIQVRVRYKKRLAVKLSVDVRPLVTLQDLIHVDRVQAELLSDLLLHHPIGVEVVHLPNVVSSDLHATMPLTTDLVGPSFCDHVAQVVRLRP